MMAHQKPQEPFRFDYSEAVLTETHTNLRVASRALGNFEHEKVFSFHNPIITRWHGKPPPIEFIGASLSQDYTEGAWARKLPQGMFEIESRITFDYDCRAHTEAHMRDAMRNLRAHGYATAGQPSMFEAAKEELKLNVGLGPKPFLGRPVYALKTEPRRIASFQPTATLFGDALTHTVNGIYQFIPEGA